MNSFPRRINLIAGFWDWFFQFEWFVDADDWRWVEGGSALLAVFACLMGKNDGSFLFSNPKSTSLGVLVKYKSLNSPAEEGGKISVA